MRRIGRIDADRENMRAFVAGDERFHVAEERRIGEADDFEIAFVKHRAMVAGPHGLDRRARRGRTAVDAPRREPEAQTLVSCTAALEILDRDADVIELD